MLLESLKSMSKVSVSHSTVSHISIISGNVTNSQTTCCCFNQSVLPTHQIKLPYNLLHSPPNSNPPNAPSKIHPGRNLIAHQNPPLIRKPLTNFPSSLDPRDTAPYSQLVGYSIRPNFIRIKYPNPQTLLNQARAPRHLKPLHQRYDYQTPTSPAIPSPSLLVIRPHSAKLLSPSPRRKPHLLSRFSGVFWLLEADRVNVLISDIISSFLYIIACAAPSQIYISKADSGRDYNCRQNPDDDEDICCAVVHCCWLWMS